MTNKMMKAAMALTVAGAVALPASQAAAGTSKTESALLGALLGGVACAVVVNAKPAEVPAWGACDGRALRQRRPLQEGGHDFAGRASMAELGPYLAASGLRRGIPSQSEFPLPIVFHCRASPRQRTVELGSLAAIPRAAEWEQVQCRRAGTDSRAE